MAATAPATSAHDPPASDLYDPDEVFLQNSPLMKPHHPRLEPSPSPPPDVPPPKVSHSPKRGRKKSSNRRGKVRPSQGDAVLIRYLDGGKRPEIADEARKQPLLPLSDEDEESSSGLGIETSDESGDDQDIRSSEMSPDVHPPRPAQPAGPIDPATVPAAVTTASPIDHLQSLATTALAAVTAVSHPADANDRRTSNGDPRIAPRANLPDGLTLNAARDDAREGNKSALAPPFSPYSPQGSHDVYSPRHQVPGQILVHRNCAQSSPTSLSPTGIGELAPIQNSPPRSETSSHDPLPSIELLLDQISPSQDMERRGSQFANSPPSGVPRLGGIPGNHGSPPISPNDPYYRQGLLSPASSMMSQQSHYPSGFSSTGNYRPGIDYIENGNTPGTDISSTAGTQGSITDRMSIDNMTNPAMGAFVCKVDGCTAPAFSTQYLLNSHANVHSSARPHYCPVKDCPRSEGGKGFKRKNEMIRHGLVHDSPGYVCPFCPDREHKYPRPDNLQRHVRVHHIDKNKDDPQLRDVLAQRPDGPSRGRRRRGGT